jgi:hypothetical protein
MATTPLVTQSSLLIDAVFKNRTTMAILHTAESIQYEDPATPNHDNRIGLAAMAFKDPISTMSSMYTYIIIQPSIYVGAADSSTIADQSIMDAVSAVWDQLSKILYVPPPVPPTQLLGVMPPARADLPVPPAAPRAPEKLV